MDTKEAKMRTLCGQVTLAAQAYQRNLVGRAFLYVFGEECIEVLFRTDDFFHLTGLESCLDAKDFYDNAKNSKLSHKQIYFKPNHPYDLVKKKLPCLSRLDELTKHKVTILKDMKTSSITYKVGLTNVSFTVGMYYKAGYYSPQTLRVKDNSLRTSRDAVDADFIFGKKYGENQYNVMLFSQSEKEIPQKLLNLLAPDCLPVVIPSSTPNDISPSETCSVSSAENLQTAETKGAENLPV